MTTAVWGRPAPVAVASPPRRVEVAVVGAGITGLAIAAALAARGVGVAILERDHVAAGASGRNAGLLLTGVAHSYAAAVAQHGRATAAEVWRFTAANHGLLIELLGGAEAAARAGHRRDGAWTLPADTDEAAELRRSATLLAEDGLPGTWYAAGRTGEVGEALPPWVSGGLLTPGDGVLDPVAGCAAIAARLVGSGVALVEGTAVRLVEAAATGVRLSTSAGEVEADACILATNAETAALAPVAIRPVRAQMLACAPAGSGPRGMGRPAYSHRGHRYWRRLDAGGTIVGGCRELALDVEVGTDATPTALVQGHLERFAREALELAGPVTHRWAGTMGFSPDDLPIAGPVPGRPRLHVCGGYTGHGMGFAVGAAQAVVASMVASEPLPRWLSADRG